mgnify:CR=1 FL=1
MACEFSLRHTVLVVALLALSGCMATVPPPSTVPSVREVEPAGPLHNPQAPFQVTLAVRPAGAVVAGNPLSLALRSEQSGFAQLYSLRASGSALVLARNLPVTAGVAQEFPGPRHGFALQAQPPAGRDRVVLVVTRAPFAGPPDAGSAAEGDRPFVVPVMAARFRQQLVSALADLPADSWNGAEQTVDVLVRK